MRKAIWVGVGLFGLWSISTATSPTIPAYSSLQFKKLIAESYRFTGRPNSANFYSLMNAKLRTARNQTWEQLIAQSRSKLAKAGSKGRKQAILDISADLHRAVKQTMPTFTLDRGFEFANAAAKGERQCLLQSVFIAGLLQEMSIDAGIAMVWKNDKGQVSNMGHVCAVVPLPGRQQVVVDASDPTPFMDHQGLFLRIANQGYRFVEPIYQNHLMVGLKDLKAGKTVSPALLRALDLNYVKSQFDFYRGERFPDGILSNAPSRAGLSGSEKLFRESLNWSPQNPLSMWLLSQTLRKKGDAPQADALKVKATKLYGQFGWIPPSLR